MILQKYDTAKHTAIHSQQPLHASCTSSGNRLLLADLNARAYAGARDLWECDFITPDTAIQACVEIKPAKLDGFVKSPDAALRCILRRCGAP